MNNKELLQSLLPIIRADLKLCEIYIEHYREDEPLECPIHVFWSDGEHELDDSKLMEWKKETKNRFTIDKFTGDHFFLHKDPELITKKMLDYIT